MHQTAISNVMFTIKLLVKDSPLYDSYINTIMILKCSIKCVKMREIIYNTLKKWNISSDPLQQKGAVLEFTPEFHSDVSFKNASEITLLMLLPDS